MNRLKNKQRIKHMLIKRWGKPETVAGVNLFVDEGWSINGLTDC